MNTENISELNKRIMRRVRLIFFCKKYLLNSLAAKVYFSALLLWALISTVSIGSVFKNMVSIGISVSNTTNFYKYAFMNTELVVQAVTISSVVFISLLVLDSVKRLGLWQSSRQIHQQ